MTGALPRSNPAAHSMPALTGLRGLAAVWVLVYHAWVYATPRALVVDLFGEPFRLHVLFSLGWAGVHVLFVLSGFLLTLPYARANAGCAPSPRLSRYLLHRVARVFPAYYLQLLLLVLVSLTISGVMLVNGSNLLQYLLMLYIPPPLGIGAPASVNGVWWTLPIELSFYFLLPIVAPLADARCKLLLIGAAMLSMLLWRCLVVNIIQPTTGIPVWMYQLPGSMDTFGLGMLGAVLHVQYGTLVDDRQYYDRALSILLWMTPVIFFLLGVWMANDYTLYWTNSLILYLWTPLFGLAVLVVILACARNKPLFMLLLGNRGVFYVGTVSYGLYLWHAPLGDWLRASPLIAGMQAYPFPRLALLMFLGALALASVSWYLVEARAIAVARRV